MSAMQETKLISVLNLVNHVNMDIQKMSEFALQISKMVMALLLQMRRSAKTSLRGGDTESVFDVKAIQEAYDSSESSMMKVIIITTYFYKALPFINEGITSLQLKLSILLALGEELKHMYQQLRILNHEDMQYGIMQEAVNLLSTKMNLQIMDSVDHCKRLVQTLQDGFNILNLLLKIDAADKIFNDVKEIYVHLSRDSLKTYQTLKSITLLDLEVII
jgi:hypothetical protein